MTSVPSNRPAETSTPVEIRFGTSPDQRRVTVLFRMFLVVLQGLVLAFVGIGAFFVVLLGWFAALATGRLPVSFARFLLGYLRWNTRVAAYAFLLTDRYPAFSLDPDPTYPVDVIVTTGRLNRAAVLFRVILVIPANIVGTALTYGMYVFAVVTWVITLVWGRMPDSLFGASAAAIRYQSRVTGHIFMLTSVYPGDLLGDKWTTGQRIETAVSGTLEMQPAPAGPPVGWMPGQALAWGGQQGTYAPAPPPPPPPPPPAWAYPPHAMPSMPPPPLAAPLLSPMPQALPAYYGSGGFGDHPMRLWPLALTKAARTMTVVFVIVGALVYVAYTATFRSNLNLTSIQASIASARVEAAYNSLNSASQTFIATNKACGTTQCLDQAEAAWIGAFQTYATAMAQITYPPSAQAEANAAEEAATNSEAILRTSFAAPAGTAVNPEIPASFRKIDSTYS